MPPRKPCIERKADSREAVELINKHIRESVMQQARIMVAAPELLRLGQNLLVSLDPNKLNVEQFNAFCELDAEIALVLANEPSS